VTLQKYFSHPSLVRVDRPPTVHMPVSVWPVGVERTFFDRHLKTHDRTFARKHLGLEIFFEWCSKIRGEVRPVPFFLALLGVGVMCKKKKKNKLNGGGFLELCLRVSLGLKLQAT